MSCADWPGAVLAATGDLDPLEYVLNRMEAAANKKKLIPAEHGYAQARRDLLDGIAELRNRVTRAERGLRQIRARINEIIPESKKRAPR